MKTRLQSAEGFAKAGGFRGLYSGVGAVAAGSAPVAGLFFCVYEPGKSYLYGRGVNAQLSEMG